MIEQFKILARSRYMLGYDNAVFDEISITYQDAEQNYKLIPYAKFYDESYVINNFSKKEKDANKNKKK